MTALINAFMFPGRKEDEKKELGMPTNNKIDPNAKLYPNFFQSDIKISMSSKEADIMNSSKNEVRGGTKTQVKLLTKTKTNKTKSPLMKCLKENKLFWDGTDIGIVHSGNFSLVGTSIGLNLYQINIHIPKEKQESFQRNPIQFSEYCGIRKMRSRYEHTFHVSDQLKPCFGLQKLGLHRYKSSESMMYLIRAPPSNALYCPINMYENYMNKEIKYPDFIVQKIRHMIAFQRILNINMLKDSIVLVLKPGLIHDQKSNTWSLSDSHITKMCVTDVLLYNEGRIEPKKEKDMELYSKRIEKQWFPDVETLTRTIVHMLLQSIGLCPDLRTALFRYRCMLEEVFRKTDAGIVWMVLPLMKNVEKYLSIYYQQQDGF